MERFFSNQAIRPKAFELLTLLKGRSDCVYMTEDLARKSQTFHLDSQNTISFKVKEKYDDEYIINKINEELARLEINKDSVMERNIRLDLARYRSLVHNVKMFKEKAAEIHGRELRLLEDIFLLFLNEEA